MLPLGIWLGYRAFRDYGLADIAESLVRIPFTNLVLAFACAAGSYVCLTGFDTLAVRHVGRPLAYGQIALASFVSLSIGHNVGVAVLSSGTLRYRFYSGFGLSAIEVGEVILFCALTVGLGLMTLGGLVLLLRPDLGLAMIGLPSVAARGIGVLCVALAGAYVLLASQARRPLSIRGRDFRVPNARIATAQIAIGTANFAFVAATLYQLLAGAAAYPETVAAYVLGNVTALMSHVPGGLGVLEYVISSLVIHGQVVGALIAFRIVYFLVPLVLGSVLLAAAEVSRWRGS
jgi:uncharacterized membrane protein YbhN (UPF0104 family)